MTTVVLFLTVIALAALSLGVLAIFQARHLIQATEARNAGYRFQCDARWEELRNAVDSLAAEVRELQCQPAAAPGSAKPALNLSKRSQALRMHRRGETADQIATALDLPSQEVDLLIKVHRIVLDSV